MWQWYIAVLVSADWFLHYDETVLIHARSTKEVMKITGGMVGSIVACGPNKPEVTYETEYVPGEDSTWFSEDRL